jgi:hypothetical protein
VRAIGTGVSHVNGVASDWADGWSGSEVNAPAALVDARLEELLSAASGPVNWRLVAANEATRR